MKIIDIFHILTGVRITEEEVYKHKGDIPCVTAQTLNDGIAWYADEGWLSSFTMKGRPVIVEEPCITWSKVGAKAGTLIYRDYKFYINDNGGVLIPRNEKEVNLKWFLYTQQENIFNQVTNKDGQGTLFNGEMSNIEIDLPSWEEQEEIVKEYERISELLNVLTEFTKGYEELYSLPIYTEGEELFVKQICNVDRGSVISEVDIYKNYDANGIPVYSSKTENNGIMGHVSKDFYNKFTNKGEPNTLTWNTDGNAGKVFLREEEYLYTNVCGKLTLKPDKQINLKWLQIVLNNETKKYTTSNANNGKLMSGQMKNIKIKVPDIKIQEKIVEEYKRIEDFQLQLQEALDSINL